MSIAVAKIVNNKMQLCFDSASTTGDAIQRYDTIKGGILSEYSMYAYAGDLYELDLFQEFVELHKEKLSILDDKPFRIKYVYDIFTMFEEWGRGVVGTTFKINNEFLVCVQDRILVVSSNDANNVIMINNYKDFWAIGSGSDFAYGMLISKKNPKKVVEEVCKIDPYCALPLVLHEYEINKK